MGEEAETTVGKIGACNVIGAGRLWSTKVEVGLDLELRCWRGFCVERYIAEEVRGSIGRIVLSDLIDRVVASLAAVSRVVVTTWVGIASPSGFAAGPGITDETARAGTADVSACIRAALDIFAGALGLITGIDLVSSIISNRSWAVTRVVTFPVSGGSAARGEGHQGDNEKGYEWADTHGRPRIG